MVSHQSTARPFPPKELKREETRHSQITIVDNPTRPTAATKEEKQAESGPFSVQLRPKPTYRLALEYLGAEVDKDSTRLPVAICCFVSGFTGAISFSACSTWVGFQSGNTVQTAMALSRLAYDPSPGSHVFRASDYQAMCSVVAFALAAQLGGRCHPFSLKSRGWLAFTSTIQLVLTIIAAVLIHLCNEPSFSLSRENPSWHNVYGYLAISMMSASLGLQGVMGESLGTGFTASVVLTSIWCQLALLPFPKTWSKPRDDRFSAIILFCLGGFFSRMLIVKIQSSGALAVVAGIRFLVIPLFMLCRAEEKVILPFTSPWSSRRSSRLNLSPNDSRLTMVDERRGSK